MNTTVNREQLAREAWYELNALFDLIERVKDDERPALRGMCMRGRDLIAVMHAAIVGEDFANDDDVRELMYGHRVPVE